MNNKKALKPSYSSLVWRQIDMLYKRTSYLKTTRRFDVLIYPLAKARQQL